MPNQLKHQLYLTDCVEGVKKLPDNSLDLVLTGPPYFNHVKYSSDNQNLSTKEYDDFLKESAKLWKNIEPKLKDGGMIALWLHDIYCLNRDSQDSQDSQDFFELKPFHSDIITTMPTILKLRNIEIWDRYLKKTYLDLPDKQQFGTRFQYILFFSKGRTNYEKEFKRLYWNPIWYFKTEPEFMGFKRIYRILFWIGKNRFLYKLLDPLFSKVKKYLLKDKYQFKEYLTTCPSEAAGMIIKKFSRPGDIICDPFLGSGTTMKIANDLSRNCVGFEINQDAKEVILKKVGSQNIEIFD